MFEVFKPARIAAVAAFLVLQPIAAEAHDLTVFAAASMKNALDAINTEYTRKTGDKVVVSYAASSALAKQIESGAPADIFVSADQDWMDYVEKADLIEAGTRRDILANRIVLIAPAVSGTEQIEIEKGFPLAAMLGDERLAMANTDSVPAGKYGRASLEALGVWASVEQKVAQADNVRAALLLVSRQEAPLGIVYRTDANADAGVKVIGTFPADTHPAIVYPVATTKKAGEAARPYLDFLKTATARAVFEAQGFQVVD